jgi:hypothetical protein
LRVIIWIEDGQHLQGAVHLDLSTTQHLSFMGHFFTEQPFRIEKCSIYVHIVIKGCVKNGFLFGEKQRTRQYIREELKKPFSGIALAG